MNKQVILKIKPNGKRTSDSDGNWPMADFELWVRKHDIEGHMTSNDKVDSWEGDCFRINGNVSCDFGSDGDIRVWTNTDKELKVIKGSCTVITLED